MAESMRPSTRAGARGDPELLWRALKIVCKWAASDYYSESTWQETLREALRLARGAEGAAASTAPKQDAGGAQ